MNAPDTEVADTGSADTGSADTEPVVVAGTIVTARDEIDDDDPGRASLPGAFRPRWMGQRGRRRTGRRMRRSGVVAVWMLVVTTVVLLVLPTLLSLTESEIAGTPFAEPLGEQFLGTDSQGRDVAERALLGMRVSWFAALAVIAVGVTIGGMIGLVSGFSGGIVDAVLMRLTDAALALPGPLVALAVVAALGPSLKNTLIAVALTWWPWYARIVRSQVRALMGRPHVEAARAGGLSRTRVALVHVVPGTLSAVLVAASLDVGAVILVLAGLSFLGLGSPAPAAELGAMTAQGLTYLFNAPWVAVVPALGLFLLAVLANFVGDAMSDALEA